MDEREQAIAGAVKTYRAFVDRGFDALSIGDVLDSLRELADIEQPRSSDDGTAGPHVCPACGSNVQPPLPDEIEVLVTRLPNMVSRISYPSGWDCVYSSEWGDYRHANEDTEVYRCKLTPIERVK